MSHSTPETQCLVASQHQIEPHDIAASERRESLEYLKLVVRRLYDAQKLRIQSDLRVQRLEREGIVIGERIENTFAKAQELEVQTEKEYEKIVARELKQYTIWSKWLKDVKGIGPRIAGLLIANIADPARFANVAKLWAYAGMHTQPVCGDCDHVLSHAPSEPQVSDASQVPIENHATPASQSVVESRRPCASQKPDEPHQGTASQKWHETPRVLASQRKFEPHCQLACPKCGSKNIANRAARRRAGHKANWSSELKTTLWKAAGSFVKTRGPYRTAYETYKNNLIERQMRRNEIIWRRDTKTNKYAPAFLPTCFHEGNTPKPPEKPDWTLGRIDAMAKRWTAKLFLSHLWAAWRELEGMPVTKPYAFETLKHKDYVSPWLMIDDANIEEVSRLLKQNAA